MSKFESSRLNGVTKIEKTNKKQTNKQTNKRINMHTLGYIKKIFFRGDC